MNIYKSDLISLLKEVSKYFKQKVTMVAVGGTALTLLDLKDSTIDIDFDIPFNKDYEIITNTFNDLGFSKTSSFSWDTSPVYQYRFYLFKAGYIFSTQLTQDSNKNSIQILKTRKLALLCLNPLDLIITKLFRSAKRDIDDSIICFEHFHINALELINQYMETFKISMHSLDLAKSNIEYFLRLIKTDKETNKQCQKLIKTWH
ncbi:MAG: DUF6036 family nucleotidyltransferase [Pseudomonadota bacterium]